MEDFLKPDLCVIGAGSGGLAIAEAARRHGASVVLVERDRMGGTRLNSGCLPSKALAAAAAHAQAMRSASAFGIANDPPKVNFRGVHDHVQKVVAAAADQDAVERFEALGVTVLGGEASFVDRRTIKVGDQMVRARRFVLATGSRPRVPLIPGLDEIESFTTDSIFENARKLTHLLVVGGGARAIELAQSYRRLGCDVTVVEAGVALPESDPELAEIALRRLAEEGVVVRQHTSITAFLPRSMGIGVAIKVGDLTEQLDVSHVLVAIGRQANLEALELDKAGIRFDKADGLKLKVSPKLRTSNRRVYAIGDVAGGAGETPLARLQAEAVVANALYGKAIPLLDAPRSTLIDPEIAEAGLTEPQAKAKLKTSYRVLRAGLAENDRARAMLRDDGVIKLILDKAGQIVGAGVVGPHAGEIIGLLTLAIARKLTLSDLADLALPYPSLADSIRAMAAADRAGAPLSSWSKTMLGLNRVLP